MTSTLHNFHRVQCVSEGIRGKKDWINGSLGGAAAGAMLGLRSTSVLLPFIFFSMKQNKAAYVSLITLFYHAVGRLKTGVGAAALLAAVSAAADMTGGKLTGAEDTTPQRRIYPYER